MLRYIRYRYMISGYGFGYSIVKVQIKGKENIPTKNLGVVSKHSTYMEAKNELEELNHALAIEMQSRRVVGDPTDYTIDRSISYTWKYFLSMFKGMQRPTRIGSKLDMRA